MEIYDLTLRFSVEMPVFPGTPAMSYTLSHTIEKDHYNLGIAAINSHAGTHTDAPRHFLADGITLADVDINKYVGYAVIADCSGKKPFESIDVNDLLPFSDKIMRCKRVLIKTGWSSHFCEKEYYTDYPILTEKLAYWLVEKGVILVGVEPPSLNPEKYIEVHQILLKNGVEVVEGLTNLDKIPKDEIFFVGPPIGIKEADGFPIRAIGIDF